MEDNFRGIPIHLVIMLWDLSRSGNVVSLCLDVRKNFRQKNSHTWKDVAAVGSLNSGAGDIENPYGTYILDLSTQIFVTKNQE